MGKSWRAVTLVGLAMGSLVIGGDNTFAQDIGETFVQTTGGEPLPDFVEPPEYGGIFTPYWDAVELRAPNSVFLFWEDDSQYRALQYIVYRNGVAIATQTRAGSTAPRLSRTMTLTDLPVGRALFEVQAVYPPGFEGEQFASPKSDPIDVVITGSRLKSYDGVAAIYDRASGCIDVSWMTPEEGVLAPSITIYDNGRPVSSSPFPPRSTQEPWESGLAQPRRVDERVCEFGRGYTAYIQVENTALESSPFASVKTTPIPVFKAWNWAPTGFEARVNGDTTTLTWDGASTRTGAETFLILDTGRPLVSLNLETLGTDLTLSPGKHWLQLVTVDEYNGQSRRTSPLFIEIPDNTTLS